MYQFRQILTHMRSGQSDRQIAKAGLMGRPKAGALRVLALEHGWLDPAQPLPDDAVLAEKLKQEFMGIAHLAQQKTCKFN